VLRANFFMTNLIVSADPVRGAGTLPAPAGGGAVAMIDPRDVAAAAAAVLADPHAVAGRYELTGPAAVTYGDVARILSQATGRPIHYVDLPEQAATDAFTDSRLPDWLVTHLTGAFRLIREGGLGTTTDTIVTLTGRPPRSLATFAADHAGAFAPTEPGSTCGDGPVRAGAAEPQDIAWLFIKLVNAGDIDGLAQLYEPEAVLHFPPGNLARGRDAIRQVITQLLAGNPTMTGKSTGVIRLGDLALTSGQWSMTGTGPDGVPSPLAGTPPKWSAASQTAAG
jgi:ketosteroid isomerase-like protein